MHHYSHHIGDYRRDTMHLTLLEHGVYRALLDMYYLSEKPIPTETQVVYRGLCARTQEEQQTVENILHEFFFCTANGWIHKRCDKEIAQYLNRVEHNREVGKLGGRPKKTQWVSEENPVVIFQEPKKTLTNNQEPLTNNQSKPLSSSQANIDNTPPENEKPQGIQLANGKQKHRDAAIRVLEFLNLRAGRHYRPSKTNLTLIAERLKEGASEDECRIVIARKIREWKGGEMDMYLRPATLFNATKFAQYVGEVPRD